MIKIGEGAPIDQNSGEKDETNKVDEAEIETGQKEELTEEEERKEVERKLEKITTLCENKNEEIKQEKENLPEEKRKLFKTLFQKGKDAFKRINEFYHTDKMMAEGFAGMASGTSYHIIEKIFAIEDPFIKLALMSSALVFHSAFLYKFEKDFDNLENENKQKKQKKIKDSLIS